MTRFRISITCLLLFFSHVFASEQLTVNNVPLDSIQILTVEPTSDFDIPELVVVGWYGSQSSYTVFRALVEAGFSPKLWPAVFRESWRNDARLAQLALDINLTPQHQLAIFEHQLSGTHNSDTIDDQKTLLKDFIKDDALLKSAFEDSERAKRLKLTQNRISYYPISSVPAIIFKGQFIIDDRHARTPADMVKLIQQIKLSTEHERLPQTSQ